MLLLGAFEVLRLQSPACLLPYGIHRAIEWLEDFVNLAVFLLAVTGLSWFVYAAYLKKIFRVRRIRAIRERREIHEAASRPRR